MDGETACDETMRCPPTAFITKVNSPLGKVLAKALATKPNGGYQVRGSECTVRADGPRTNHGNDVPTVPYVSAIATRQFDAALFHEYICTSKLIVCILDPSEESCDTNGVKVDEEALAAIKILRASRHNHEKTFILVSSHMTWAHTNLDTSSVVRNGVEDGSNSEFESGTLEEDSPAKDIVQTTPFSETEYKKRIPHPAYRNWYELEKLVKQSHSETLRTYVLWSGILYGLGEDLLEPLFRLAYRQRQYEFEGTSPTQPTEPLSSSRDQGIPNDGSPNQIRMSIRPTLFNRLPNFDGGQQAVPLVHISDLTRLITKLAELEEPLEERYLFALDGPSERSTWREIINALSTVTLARVVNVSATLYRQFVATELQAHDSSDRERHGTEEKSTLLRDEVLEMLTCDVRIESPETMQRLMEDDSEWTSRDGFVQNFPLVWKSFLDTHHWPPQRIYVLGNGGVENPALGDPVAVARALAEELHLPCITARDAVRNFEEGYQHAQRLLAEYSAERLEINRMRNERKKELAKKRRARRRQLLRAERRRSAGGNQEEVEEDDEDEDEDKDDDDEESDGEAKNSDPGEEENGDEETQEESNHDAENEGSDRRVSPQSAAVRREIERILRMEPDALVEEDGYRWRANVIVALRSMDVIRQAHRAYICASSKRMKKKDATLSAEQSDEQYGNSEDAGNKKNRMGKDDEDAAVEKSAIGEVEEEEEGEDEEEEEGEVDISLQPLERLPPRSILLAMIRWLTHRPDTLTHGYVLAGDFITTPADAEILLAGQEIDPTEFEQPDPNSEHETLGKERSTGDLSVGNEEEGSDATALGAALPTATDDTRTPDFVFCLNSLELEKGSLAIWYRGRQNFTKLSNPISEPLEEKKLSDDIARSDDDEVRAYLNYVRHGPVPCGATRSLQWYFDSLRAEETHRECYVCNVDVQDVLRYATETNGGNAIVAQMLHVISTHKPPTQQWMLVPPLEALTASPIPGQEHEELLPDKSGRLHALSMRGATEDISTPMGTKSGFDPSREQDAPITTHSPISSKCLKGKSSMRARILGHVGPILTQLLTECAVVKPDDPIDYVAQRLFAMSTDNEKKKERP